MAQSIETILDETGRTLLSVTADDAMGGVAINTVGIWYNHAQLVQFIDAIQKARDFLTAQGVV